jgi:GDP/UDP-N,N'-diacetylbacillosamine 2-epimerase (hydrolysing)
MTRPQKICVVTGTRAEYGLLYWTMKALAEDVAFELQLVVTGMHLSPEFGLTYRQIEADGFIIDRKVEMLLSSDTSTGISKSTGLGMIGMADAFAQLQPDMVLLLGDRFEIFAAAAAALNSRIPVVHCHGGEATEGAVDEALRHAITKMAHLHFTSTETYRKRVIQLGEAPERVFNVGALGIENINRLQLLNRPSLEESLGFRLGQRNLLVTFHPVTLEHTTAEVQTKALLKVMMELPEDVHVIFTKANADANGRIINQLLDEYVVQRPDQSKAFVSLGQLRYLSLLSLATAVIGNSSSGILEAPSFHKAVVNIGDRQKGRVQAPFTINCLPDYESIKDAVSKALDPALHQQLKSVHNPYGTENASVKIINVLKATPTDGLIKKKFYDL